MYYILLIVFFIIGTFMGSIYYYVGNRLANHDSLIDPKPRCDNCNHKLSWYEQIPVLSFIILGGKCKKCRIKLNREYLIYELLTGILFTSTFYLYGFDYKTIILLILFSLLIMIYITDFKYLIILDIPLIISVIGIIVTLWYQFNYIFVLQFILRGIIISLLFLVIKIIGDKVFKQESLGWGDVKLSFIAGLLLGLKLSFVYIFLGAVLALPYAIISRVSKNKIRVPFGPFLITSLAIVYLFSSEISNIINILLGV